MVDALNYEPKKAPNEVCENEEASLRVLTFNYI